MTEQEIKNYFGDSPVYKFNGSVEELHDLMTSLGIGYNYLVDQYQIYLVPQGDLNDSRAVLI